MSKFLAFLKRILPFVKSEKDKVAPEVKAEIDRILAEARSKVVSLKSSGNLAALRKQMEDDIKAVQETAAHHVELIKAKFEKDAAVADVAPNPPSTAETV